MEIKTERPPGQEIIELLQEHHADMLQYSPVESVHALDLEGMRAPELCFWGAWVAQDLAACGALKELSTTQGEVKSMRTAHCFLRQGMARRILEAIIGESYSRGYQQLYLETGTNDVFQPARNLYIRAGFRECDAFSDYQIDPASVFMCKLL